MNHAPRIFLLMRGGRPKVTELLAQPRLAELTTHARCLHANAPLGVLKDEPVAMQPNHHAEATADVVQVVPASQLGSLKSGGERLPAPAREAVDPLVVGEPQSVDKVLHNHSNMALPRSARVAPLSTRAGVLHADPEAPS
jgi:hypothetical protein